MNRFPICLLLLLAMLFPAVPAHAVWFWGCKPLGMGTAFTAVADDNNAIQINPAGIYILIHFSAIKNFKFQISNLSDIPIGLTLNPEDKVDDLISQYNLKKIPLIQIMSVTPGVQGNPFLPETLKKIEQLRLLGYKSKIFLDGAVNDKTLPFINEQKYKPDIVCPGSFLTKTDNLKERVQYLKKF